MRKWFAAWRYQPVEWVSALPVEEVRERMNMGLTSPFRAVFFYGGSGEHRLTGHAGRSRVTVAAGRAGVRNSWGPVLRGRLEPAGSGCRLAGKIGWHPAVWALSAVWLGGVLCAFVVLAALGVATVLMGDADGGLLLAALVPVGMTAFFVAIITWGIRAARPDETYLRSWAADRLQTVPIISPGAASGARPPEPPALRPPSPGTPAPPRT